VKDIHKDKIQKRIYSERLTFQNHSLNIYLQILLLYLSLCFERNNFFTSANQMLQTVFVHVRLSIDINLGFLPNCLHQT